MITSPLPIVTRIKGAGRRFLVVGLEAVQSYTTWSFFMTLKAAVFLLHEASLRFPTIEAKQYTYFSGYAGFAGAALGIKTLAHQLQDSSSKLPSVETFTDGRGYYLNEEALVSQIREDLAKAEKVLGRKPTALVLGALGRCGKGAVDLFLKAGMPDENITRWDLNETKDRDGPYEETAKADVFLNAIYLSKPIPPFINQELLAKKGRNLAVVIDDPTVPVEIKDDQNNLPLSVISIDHLPSMLPREASEAFSEGLKESLLTLKDRKTSRVWADAEKLFHEKVATLPEELRTKSV
ncbi:saccharopine dehydrogenase (NAD+ L-lysine forming) [Fusarium pseudocircinatum]|uniref:Saccharopine dehydrogenase (NAD+ L-lysine forming) n=1 Tax=Fusarium pseudocircinatum TaxID=56676 RepID=A0A8H5KLK3_9HYPO|nr:saccharopine dehydrogenase (NAD+ L-lysine forming) [Fusarium pseudocircinatum]